MLLGLGVGDGVDVRRGVDVRVGKIAGGLIIAVGGLVAVGEGTRVKVGRTVGERLADALDTVGVVVRLIAISKIAHDKMKKDASAKIKICRKVLIMNLGASSIAGREEINFAKSAKMYMHLRAFALVEH